MKALLLICLLLQSCKALTEMNYVKTDSVFIKHDTTAVKLIPVDSTRTDTLKIHNVYVKQQTKKPFAIKGVYINIFLTAVLIALAILKK